MNKTSIFIIILVGFLFCTIACTDEAPRGEIVMISPSKSDLEEQYLQMGDSLNFTFSFSGEADLLVVWASLRRYKKRDFHDLDWHIIREPRYDLQNGEPISINWVIPTDTSYSDELIGEEDIQDQIYIKAVTDNFSYEAIFSLENVDFSLD